MVLHGWPTLPGW